MLKMAGDEELEAIRRQKYEQMQQEPAGTAAAEQKRQEIEEAKKNIIRQILTSEARERLNTIRMTKPELAEQLEAQLIALAQTGRLKSMITDEQFKEILRQIMPKKREISIKRV
ncbi:MAG: DNA-binding protein [Methanosarcinales archaeon]|nr:DNA-binding protein [Methanosarcinales archaeon]